MASDAMPRLARRRHKTSLSLHLCFLRRLWLSSQLLLPKFLSKAAN